MRDCILRRKYAQWKEDFCQAAQRCCKLKVEVKVDTSVLQNFVDSKSQKKESKNLFYGFYFTTCESQCILAP